MTSQNDSFLVILQYPKQKNSRPGTKTDWLCGLPGKTARHSSSNAPV
jgi:hypothetical protein